MTGPGGPFDDVLDVGLAFGLDPWEVHARWTPRQVAWALDRVRRRLSEPGPECWYLMAIRLAIYEVNTPKDKRDSLPKLDDLKLTFQSKGAGALPEGDGLTEWEHRDGVARGEIHAPRVRRMTAADIALVEKQQFIRRVFGKGRWRAEWDKVKAEEEAKVEAALRAEHEALRGTRPWEERE